MDTITILGAYVPIIFRMDGTYMIYMAMQRAGSKFVQHEYVPREFLEWEQNEAKAHGGVAEPYISYGLH